MLTCAREGDGVTVALTVLLVTVAAAPFTSVKLTRAEF
jgi:hypothetical protein